MDGERRLIITVDKAALTYDWQAAMARWWMLAARPAAYCRLGPGMTLWPQVGGKYPQRSGMVSGQVGLYHVAAGSSLTAGWQRKQAPMLRREWRPPVKICHREKIKEYLHFIRFGRVCLRLGIVNAPYNEFDPGITMFNVHKLLRQGKFVPTSPPWRAGPAS